MLFRSTRHTSSANPASGTRRQRRFVTRTRRESTPGNLASAKWNGTVQRRSSFRRGSRPAPYRFLRDSTWPNCKSRCSDSESSRVRPRREYRSPAGVQFELCVIGCGRNDFTTRSNNSSSPRAFSIGSDGTTRFRIGRQKSSRGLYARDRDQTGRPHKVRRSSEVRTVRNRQYARAKVQI